MIHDALQFLKDHLNTYLHEKSDGTPEAPREDHVVFLDGAQMDPVIFRSNAVTALLINLEEEPTLRAPDRYTRPAPDGSRYKVQPDVRLNLYVLFVARFTDYANALKSLSMIIQYFQAHRVFNQQNAPDLSEAIEQLIVELVTLPFAEQNEVWNALRTAYHPSVLYRVKMIVFQDMEPEEMPVIEDAVIRMRQQGESEERPVIEDTESKTGTSS